MNDVIIMTLVPAILLGLVALVAGAVLAVCAYVENYTDERQARAAEAEVEAAPAE